MLKTFVILMFCISLTACSGKSTEGAGDPRETVWGEQVKALDKARAVEQTVQEAVERTRAAEMQ